MKNIKAVLAIVITAVVCTTIGVIAGNINANQVVYTKDNTDISVSNALDTLYSNLDTKMALNTFGTALAKSSYGDRIANRTVSQAVTKGKYLVIDTKGISFNSTDYPSVASDATNMTDTNYKNLKCASNNCDISTIVGRYTRAKSSGYDEHICEFVFLYYVNIKEENDTISAYINDGAYTTDGEYETIIAIPINEN